MVFLQRAANQQDILEHEIFSRVEKPTQLMVVLSLNVI